MKQFFFSWQKSDHDEVALVQEKPETVILDQVKRNYNEATMLS